MIVRNKKTGQFQKGNNSGKQFSPVYHPHQIQKGERVSPDTEFKKGATPHNYKGTDIPRFYTNKGRVEIIVLVDEVRKTKTRGREYLTKRRIPYSRYIWIRHYGEIPKGMVIYSNKPEGEIPGINDLELITRAELVRRNNGR